MPPKPAKKRSAAKPAAVVNSNWEPALTAEPVQEESWTPSVSFVVEGGPEAEAAIRALSLAVQRPQRRLFSLLSRDGVLTQVHELGNPKARSGDAPPFCEVNQPAKALLDAGKDVPSDLMAKILKFQLLQIKAGDQQRGEAEQVTPGGGEERKTSMKRRDDVDPPPPEFRDDEPEAGPQRYVLLIGFHQPLLIGALEAVGVHVDNVIKLCSEQQRPLLAAPPAPDQGDGLPGRRSFTPCVVIDDPGEAGRARSLDRFWAGLRPALDGGPPGSKLHDVVLLSYPVPDPPPPSDTRDPEAQLDAGTQIFDGVSNLIYACLDWRRQHRHYLDRMALTGVPAVSPVVDLRYYTSLLDLVPPEACSVALMLHCMLEQVVLSSAPVPSRVGERPGPGLDHQLIRFLLRSFLPLARTEDDRRLMVSGLMTTAQPEEDTKRLLEEFGSEQNQKNRRPLLIRHHDDRALRLRDVTAAQGFDPWEAEASMMRLSPVWRLTGSGAEEQRSNRRSSWAASRQQLQNFCSDDVVPWPEVERLLHLSVFESMPLTQTDRDGVLLEPAQQRGRGTIPWDDPLSFAQQKLNTRVWVPCSVSRKALPRDAACSLQQVALSDIQRCRIRSLIDRHHVEHHDASVLPQVLQAASEEYRCLDTFRGSHDNFLYIFCHDPMSARRHSNELWDATLHTDVGFRKYLEHVADSISDWIKEEESKREANLSPPEPPQGAEEEEEEEEPVIRRDSLKAWRLEEERLKEEALEKNPKKENSAKGQRPPREEAKPAEEKGKKSSSARTPAAPPGGEEAALQPTEKHKARTPAAPPGGEEAALQPTEKHKARAPAAPPGGEEAELQPTEKHKRFAGYATGGQLIHASGRLQHVFPSDGGQITVETIRYTEGSSLMKVVVKKDGHRFHTHINEVVVRLLNVPVRASRAGVGLLSEPVTATRVKQGSFTAALQNGVHLSYSSYGPTGEHAGSAPEQNRRGGAGRVNPPDPEPAPSVLSLSVPNGLLLQFLSEDTPEGRGVLLKQSFPLHGRGPGGQIQDPSLSEELSRTVTSQGAVIRSMRGGSTEVLFADGSVSSSPDSGPVWAQASQARPDVSVRVGTEPDPPEGRWLTTTPSGTRLHTVGSTRQRLPAAPLLVYEATDPVTQEVMLTREDLVVSVRNPDGSLIVEHADGTRITSCDRDGPPGGEGSDPPRERLVLVEKEGCAAVVLDPERRSASVSLADGTVVTGDAQGAYQVFPSNGGLLRIQSDGRSVYSSGPTGGSAPNQPGSYTMSHTGRVACDVTDLDGNRYEVMEDGKLSVEEEQEEEEQEAETHLEHRALHPPRLFLVHRDGSGSELLSSQTVDDLLRQATSDPDAALLREPLPDAQNDFGVTVLKPAHRTVWARWLLGKQNPDIVPVNLRNRSWRDFPRTEEKNPGPPFGSDVGRGLSLRERSGSGSGSRAEGPPVRSRPQVLEIRELRQHRPITALLRDAVDTRLKEFIHSLMKREEEEEERKVKDLRTEEERSHSRDVFKLLRKCLLCTSEELQNQSRTLKPGPQNPETGRTSKRLAFMHESRKRRTKQEVAEEEAQRAALRKRSVVPFFHPENVPFHQVGGPGRRSLLLDRTPVSRDPPPIPASGSSEDALRDATQGDSSEDVLRDAPQEDSSEDVLRDAPQEDSPEDALRDAPQEDSSEDVLRDAPQGDSSEDALRDAPQEDSSEDVLRDAPHGDSPEDALRDAPQGDSSEDILRDAPQGDSSEDALRDAPQGDSPEDALRDAPQEDSSEDVFFYSKPKTRPTNPTPQPAGERALSGSAGRFKSVHLDVTGGPRRSKVRLPASILSSKPRSEPNQQFLSVEEPARRRCCYVSLSDPRGFQLLPSAVDFGTLREGSASAVTVRMRNVGVDTCRFHVKPPPPSSGLRVVYNPGPVPAGLHVDLQVQLLALSAVQSGAAAPQTSISHDVVIQTELEILHLPVRAAVLPQRLYDVWLQDHRGPPHNRDSRVRPLSSSPPGGDGRPAGTGPIRVMSTRGQNRTCTCLSVCDFQDGSDVGSSSQLDSTRGVTSAAAAN
ncbi:sperm-associated antigen 17 [Brachionichthys hirsutus]|uniref:sperm-associated antigen 17 n=1 Tax=Brachionichthys hirsutus TaxID=412623 RepID=UPI0036052782